MKKSTCSFMLLMLVSFPALAEGNDIWSSKSHKPNDNWALPKLGTADDYVGSWNKKTHVLRLTDTLSISKLRNIPYRGTGLQYNMGKDGVLWFGSLQGPGSDHKAPGNMWEYHF